MSNGRFAMNRMKIQQPAKTQVEIEVEDKSGPKSWALSAALFVPITGTQEEQARSSKK